MSGHAADAVDVVVNGQVARVHRGCTIAELIAGRGLVGKRFAVELNGTIVPRSLHGTTALTADDRAEIVVAVGGG